MSVPAFGPSSIDPDTARSVSDIAELLDVVYENARQAATASSVSTTQLRLMFLLDRQPGIRMSALAQLLGAAAPSVTRLCDRLEATGFLRRHPGPGDGRELTPGSPQPVSTTSPRYEKSASRHSPRPSTP